MAQRLKAGDGDISDPEFGRHLKEDEAADYLGFSPRALQNWRRRGNGPRFVRVSSRAVRYRLHDLMRWSADRLARSTSDVPG